MFPAHPHSFHVAIILDGNRRWAARRGLPHAAAYAAGARAAAGVVGAAPQLGITTLTLFAFSSDNWQRSAPAAAAPLRAVEEFLKEFTREAREVAPLARVRIGAIGRRDRLPDSLRAAIAEAETLTQKGRALELRLAIDYSARDAILRAACRMYTATEVTREAFSRLLSGVAADSAGSPDVDLVIRTGGEQRLSDFLLWEAAYAELHFTPRLWPDFTAQDLAAAVEEFHQRDRRFGRLPAAAVS
jgi:undecaprenyl diphosphate synthase